MHRSTFTRKVRKIFRECGVPVEAMVPYSEGAMAGVDMTPRTECPYTSKGKQQRIKRAWWFAGYWDFLNER